jgi:hypothetical protein
VIKEANGGGGDWAHPTARPGPGAAAFRRGRTERHLRGSLISDQIMARASDPSALFWGSDRESRGATAQVKGQIPGKGLVQIRTF